MYRLIEGGHWDKEDRYYSFYVTLPEINKTTVVDINGNDFTSKEISLPTKIYLQFSKIYSNIGIRILGFGFGIEVAIRRR